MDQVAAKFDLDVRKILVTSLSQRDISKIIIIVEFDDIEVINIMSCNHTPALVIHKRYLIDNTLVGPNVPENLYIGCTFLQVRRRQNKQYTKTYFKVRDVVTYLTRGKSQVILHLLHTI